MGDRTVFILQSLHRLIDEVLPRGRKKTELFDHDQCCSIYEDLVIEIDRKKNWKIDFSVFKDIVTVNAVIGYSNDREENSIPLVLVKFTNGEISNVPDAYIIENNFLQTINELKKMRKIDLFYHKISCA
jgi:hypothetical protein